MIEPLAPEHWDAVVRIYAAGIASGHATFEESPPDAERFDAGHLAEHRFVALLDGAVVGWVAASPTSPRPVYAGVVEHSIYVDPVVGGRGVGRQLLDAFVASCDEGGIWTIQSGIFPENTASLRLHRAAGFRDVGRREALGLMRHGPCAGRWRDVLLLERRSAIVGRP